MDHRRPVEPDAYNWAFIGLAVVLAGLHLYLGVFAGFVPRTRAAQFVAIGVAFLFGPVVYFTPYWRPLLYLLGVGFAAYLGALWLFSGMQYVAFGALASVAATGFVVLGLYLFYRESARNAE